MFSEERFKEVTNNSEKGMAFQAEVDKEKDRRRENTVGVNMVLAAAIRHCEAICKCVEGSVLEPCLFQPCFHVAGKTGT